MINKDFYVHGDWNGFWYFYEENIETDTNAFKRKNAAITCDI